MLKVVGASWDRIRLSTWIIGIVFALGIVAIIYTETGGPSEDGNYSATAYWDSEVGFSISFWGQGNDFEKLPKGVARAHYDPHINEKGWAIFEVETQGSYIDATQARAAGMLEGALTWQMIYWHWTNTVSAYCEEEPQVCDSIRHHLQTNMDWALETAQERDTDEYWHQVNLFYVQLQGIEQGFSISLERTQNTEIEPITIVDILWMNIFSDVEDLKKKFALEVPDKSLEPSSTTSQPPLDQKFNCAYGDLPLSSAFVKFVPQKEALYFAHNSAGPYSNMLKMFKRYEFQYHRTSGSSSEMAPGVRLSFSSYPASVHSMDDFYVISNTSGHSLAVAATPITVYDLSLYHHVSSKGQLLTGPRALAASRLASSPEQWASMFSRHNSGTGNKQWIITDVRLFDNVTSQRHHETRYTPEHLENLFWVLEQIPGHTESADQTHFLLNQTYWASYGIPFYKNIYKISGTQDMAEEHGCTFSYNETALANIFRRDHSKAINMDGVSKLMRSNMYKEDPYSEGNPRCAVGSRADFALEDAEPEGVTDVKVFRNNPPPFVPLQVRNSTLRTHLDLPRLHIMAGPVHTDNDTPDTEDDVGPFQWTDSPFKDVPHTGQPDTWTFPPVPILKV